MALKLFTDNPRITDTILLKIQTTDASGCLENPYKIDSVTVYYAERNFLGVNYGEYDYKIQDQTLVAAIDSAVAAACLNPTTQNLAVVQNLQQQLASNTISVPFYYKEQMPVKIIGTPNYPAWLSTDLPESPFKQSLDGNNNPIEGTFEFEWSPDGSVREGNYFLCWTWTLLPAGGQLTSHVPFYVVGDPNAVTAIPTNITPPDKYDVLLERYLPEMYKSFLTDDDLTPEITYKLNKAIGSGFTVLENFADQIIELFDANVLHESLLSYLSNLFALRLKSDDPTLWRRQIKEAIPLFKKKGTKEALSSAFAQSGMVLNSITQHWQLISKYTYQESFKVSNSANFVLSKKSIVLPIDDNNFGVWVRRQGSPEYYEYSSDYVTFTIDEECHDKITMTWIGDQLSSSPVDLYEGDIVRVLYEYNDVPNSSEQQLENYFRALPLLDNRDEFNQDYPPKNWNVRIIDETDPLFSVLVPVKHPFEDPLVFGFVRTEFAYSENIYNMEEYNGSTRPSYDACNIDKSFVDPCGACIGSSYSVDIGVENLCNDRMIEAQDVLQEFMPFHAVLQTISFTGEVNEFVQPPIESIDFLIHINKVEYHLSGEGNPIFTRHIPSPWVVNRSDLANRMTVLSGKLGTATNDCVSIVAPDVIFSDLGIIPDNHVLQVLAPSPNAGTYTLTNINDRMAEISSSVVEPLDESQFTFNLFNIIYGNFSTSIVQDNYFKFTDLTVLFEDLGVKTLWDTTHTADYSGGSWSVLIPAYSSTPYLIRDIVNGALILNGDSNLPTTHTTNISYTLLDDHNTTMYTSDQADLEIDIRALVNFNDTNLQIHDYVNLGDFLYYNNSGYKIAAFSGQNFWIEDWQEGDMSGVHTDVRRQIAKQQVGQFGYQGLHLVTFSDHEAEFQIGNGDNPPTLVLDDNNFKENYMFQINGCFFRIKEWDGVNVSLSGMDQYWMTAAAGGTVVSYSIIHLPKIGVNVGFTVFDELDRDGHDPVIRTIQDPIGNLAIVALSTGSTGMEENVGQEEGVSFTIQTRNGNKQEGVAL
jgi:hypothetical protein